MVKVLLVGLGGFVGTLFRYWIADIISRRYGETFPVGTLAVNALGCFMAGALLYLLYDRFPANATIHAAVFIGLLGGLTTFSAFGLQTFALLKDGQMLLALLNILASNILCLFLVWLGYVIAKAI